MLKLRRRSSWLDNLLWGKTVQRVARQGFSRGSQIWSVFVYWIFSYSQTLSQCASDFSCCLGRSLHHQYPRDAFRCQGCHQDKCLLWWGHEDAAGLAEDQGPWIHDRALPADKSPRKWPGANHGEGPALEQFHFYWEPRTGIEQDNSRGVWVRDVAFRPQLNGD